ncbi:MAG: hypothetical protein CBB90_13910 [Gammaproteobacteria bacterium TMED30]|nr:MAG: hypothetical protein CBB90_13910 [Gammaproteobacteria bacterium TMED30]
MRNRQADRNLGQAAEHQAASYPRLHPTRQGKNYQGSRLMTSLQEPDSLKKDEAPNHALEF